MKKKQRDVFIEHGGNEWFRRNIARLGIEDPVSDIIDALKLEPHNVLEIGCANGWRLKKLHDKYKCRVAGIEPSLDAINNHFKLSFIERYIHQGGAHNLKAFTAASFDVVIYGWCLYLCDPEDYLQIAAEGDRVLREGGYLIIHDFRWDGFYKVPYEHTNGIFAYHYNYGRLWMASPAYRLVTMNEVGNSSVVVLRKSIETAFPEKIGEQNENRIPWPLG